jgi:para-nitrobenzyl esterase
MSGGGLGERRPGTPLDTAEAKNQAMMEYFEKTTLEGMRTLSFDELLEMTTVYGDSMKTRIPFSPVIDGYFLKKTFTEAAQAGEISDIPYMIGFTSNDMGDQTESVSDFCALRATQSDQPAYAYLFQRQLPGSDHGAFHSSDLWYIFHSLRHSWRPFTAGDEALSTKMLEYYTNFAKFGNPNGMESGTWTPFTAESPAYMIFDAGENEAQLTMSDEPKHIGAATLR